MSNEYARGELARAFRTASSHEDPDARRRADTRARDWVEFLTGVASGRVFVGSRTPVRGLPPWVSLKVMRGGFATGRASANTPLDGDETARLTEFQLPMDRKALFASYLTQDGLDELLTLVGNGNYAVQIPEDSALLTVAALVRAGHRPAALELLDTLRPWSAKLRLTPRRATAPTLPPGYVSRRTVGELVDSLRAATPNARVETQREVLGVWLPLTDQFVQFWITRLRNQDEPGAQEELATAQSLVAAYDAALGEKRPGRKYRDPKENLPILLAATRALLAGTFDQRQLGRVQHVLRCIVAKRGVPDDDSARALRAAQAAVRDQPPHRHLLLVAAERATAHRLDEGLTGVEGLLAPVTPEESAVTSIPAGTKMPRSLGSKVTLALAAPVEQLVSEGIVPSAEVLAELIPSLTAHRVASAFKDPALGALVGATYTAFRRRRSVLLVNLAKQVQFAELPWVEAALSAGAAHNQPDDPAEVARKVAALAIDSFPGSILPNALIRELSTLYTHAGFEVALTEELAADIFMGRFSPKFVESAKLAATLLGGSLYELYFGLDFDQVVTLSSRGPTSRSLSGDRFSSGNPSLTLESLCQRGVPRTSWRTSVVGNGMMIERQQLLTTHNLAALVTQGAVEPNRPWESLAVEAADRAFELLAQARSQQRALSTVKDSAYAWRQAVFFASMSKAERQSHILTTLRSRSLARQWPVSEVVDGLATAVREGKTPDRPFLGWAVGGHWALSPLASSVGRG